MVKDSEDTVARGELAARATTTAPEDSTAQDWLVADAARRDFDDETVDGLSPIEEEVRHAAEDLGADEAWEAAAHGPCPAAGKRRGELQHGRRGLIRPGGGGVGHGQRRRQQEQTARDDPPGHDGIGLSRSDRAMLDARPSRATETARGYRLCCQNTGTYS